jgi:hypothetical protein
VAKGGIEPPTRGFSSLKKSFQNQTASSIGQHKPRVQCAFLQLSLASFSAVCRRKTLNSKGIQSLVNGQHGAHF